MTSCVDALKVILTSDQVPDDLIDFVLTHQLAELVDGDVISNPAIDPGRLPDLFTLATTTGRGRAAAGRYVTRMITSGKTEREAITMAVTATQSESNRVEIARHLIGSVSAHALVEVVGNFDPGLRAAALTEELLVERLNPILAVPGGIDAAASALDEYLADKDSYQKARAIEGMLRESTEHRALHPDPLYLAAAHSEDITVQTVALAYARQAADIRPILSRWDQTWDQLPASSRNEALTAIEGTDLSWPEGLALDLEHPDLLAAVVANVNGRWDSARKRLAVDLIVPVITGQITATRQTLTHLRDTLGYDEVADLAARTWEATGMPAAPGMGTLTELLPTRAFVKSLTWDNPRHRRGKGPLPAMVLAHIGPGPNRWANALAALPDELDGVQVDEILARLSAATQLP